MKKIVFRNKRTKVVIRTIYINNKKQLHRKNGPALEWANGDKSWWFNNKLHRIDGPAIEHANCDKEWWQNGKLHRSDGPAVEKANGDKLWLQNGKFHRENGPAVEYEADGYKAWYLNDICFDTEIEWKQALSDSV